MTSLVARPVALLPVAMLAFALVVASCGRWVDAPTGGSDARRCATMEVRNHTADDVTVYHPQQSTAVARVTSLATRRVRLCGLQGAPVVFRVRAFAGRWERTVRPGMSPIDSRSVLIMSIDAPGQIWIRTALETGA